MRTINCLPAGLANADGKLDHRHAKLIASVTNMVRQSNKYKFESKALGTWNTQHINLSENENKKRDTDSSVSHQNLFIGH